MLREGEDSGNISSCRDSYASHKPQSCRLASANMSCRAAMYARSPRRCDNEGHVIKGLGSWPGFGWFEALRVYGPCSELQKNGIAYTR